MSAGAQAPGAVVRQGHLRKLKTMKKKYFVLRSETSENSARLEYYESEKKFKSGAAPRRVLPLKSCYNITRRLDLKQKHVIALFTREEQFCVVAENELDLHGWLTVLCKEHRNDDASDELLHPIQHVWQVTVQKKGLGATKNIQGLYNLCLTDKTLTLVKIKSQNNVISDLGIPERVEYSLKNIRRCGDSECFFYMEVGRQTATGAGELWMHSDDANIAQSMHSTIYHAMRNCAKETENERDHITLPLCPDGSNPLPARRQTIDGSRRTTLSNDAPTPRGRCDSMPARACASLETERPARRNDTDSMDTSRDETDSVEWYRTPRIPEEPDFCDPARDLISTSYRGSIQHSRTSSMGIDDTMADAAVDGYLHMNALGDSCLGLSGGGAGAGAGGDSYLAMAGGAGAPDGYLPMAPRHDTLGGLVGASSGSVCSGTPSTDPRFSEYQLEPATSHIIESERPPRAYSVGSRPAPRVDPPRHRAYSVGARNRPPPPLRHPAAAVSSAPLLPRASAEDLMMLDFSNTKTVVARTPPTAGLVEPRPKPVDEYVDMSPRNAGYVEMRPGERLLSQSPPVSTPDGYVEMNYGKSRPIAITASARLAPQASSPEDTKSHILKQPERPTPSGKENRTPLGSQTIFPLSLDSPASPPEMDSTDMFEEDTHHPLTTVREISEECGRRSPEIEIASSPSYVKLVLPSSKPIAAPSKTPEDSVELSCNPLANKTLARLEPNDSRGESTATVVVAGGCCGPPARFSVCLPVPAPAPPPQPPLNYASLDLEPKKGAAAPASRTYTQIDFALSEKLHAEN